MSRASDIMNKSKATYHIITGPLAVGKSTYKKKLSTTLGLRYSEEYQYGLDLKSSKSWIALIDYLKDDDSQITEVHCNYGGKDSFDRNASLGKIMLPPNNIKLYVLLPSIEVIHKRQVRRFGKYEKSETAKIDFDWYSKILESTGVRIIT